LPALPNGHQISSESSIATAVESIGISSLTKLSANDTWYTNWRQDGEDSYVFLYNDWNYSTGTVSFASTGTPYSFDAWTGGQTPILHYTVKDGYTTIPFNLAPTQSTIVVFLTTPPSGTPGVHVTSSPSSILGFSYSDSTLTAKVPSGLLGTIVTSNGKTYSISATAAPALFALGNWTLIAEKWGPPPNLTDIDTIAVKSNTTYYLPSLLSWPLIPGLANTSGVGYYSTAFKFSNTSYGAIIDFGRVVHTLRVKINGQQLPPLDFASAKADISEYLVEGVNTVQAVTATTMINGLVPILDQLMTSGGGPAFGSSTFGEGTAGKAESGLVGIVTLTPYLGVKISG